MVKVWMDKSGKIWSERMLVHLGHGSYTVDTFGRTPTDADTAWLRKRVGELAKLSGRTVHRKAEFEPWCPDEQD